MKRTPLHRGNATLKRTELPRRAPLRRAALPSRQAGDTQPIPARRATRIKPVSKKRAAEMRGRRRLKQLIFGDEWPPCARPGCPRMADDIHEILPRARSGGSITDPSIWAPLCREDNEEATREDRNDWAYEAGLMFHSWQAAEASAAGVFAAWRAEDGRWVAEMPAAPEDGGVLCLPAR